MSTTEERYTTATAASDLTDVPHRITQVDLIKASGMSRQNVASHYLRLISKATRSDMERMFAALLAICASRQMEGDHHKVVSEALNWLLDQRCKVCLGAGEVERKATMHKCPKCKGEKVRKEPASRDVRALVDYVMNCRYAHGGNMFRLLR